MEINPLAIFFVKNGSNGDKMLFKYPFASDSDNETVLKNAKRNPYSLASNEIKRNPYSLGSNESSMLQKPPSSLSDDISALNHFQDNDLSYLLAVKKKLCGDKFELKVNNIRFVGHPVNLEDYYYKGTYPKEPGQEGPAGASILSFNIVFALKVTASYDIVNCYHDLSRRLGIALCFEEQRSHFLSQEAKIMFAELDEHSEANRTKSVYQVILAKSLIAKHLKKVYQDICHYGKVHLRLNNWIDISFCLPPKINFSFGGGGVKRVTHKILMKGLENVKPYHTFLLLVDRQELLKTLSADASPTLRRLLHVHVESPCSLFSTLAGDADLTLLHTLLLAGHLVYWGKATIIYPVCNTNTYVLSPYVPTARLSKLAEKFQDAFPGSCYHQTLAEYSLPITLQDKVTPMSFPHEQKLEKQKLLWLLKHGLLQQLHTYIYIVPQTSFRAKTNSVTAMHTATARGLLATVAEAITEKPCEVTSSSCSSFRDDLEWQEEMSRTQNGTEAKTLFYKGSKDPLDDDQSYQDSTSFLNRKNNSAEDVTVSSFHVKSYSHTILSQSLTPSESDFGSVCSDERSISPGCTTSQNTEESIWQDLDNYLTSSEKDMVLSTDAAKNLEDLRLFAKLCRYFRGQHHMEEIMYRTNIIRSQLIEILDKFRTVLITVRRVDPSISFGAEPRAR